MNTLAQFGSLAHGWIGLLGVAALVIGSSANAQVQPRAAAAVEVKDWDVFVDPPTRFAFVKTPARWVFVRQLDEEQMSRLPRTTLTRLLPPDDDDVRVAHPALEPSPRAQRLRCAENHRAALADRSKLLE